MVLRPYQITQRNSVLREWETLSSTLVVSPTGSGKSVTIASIIEACQPKRAMVVAHRSELIHQNRDKITRYSGLECGIEMAETYVNNSLFGEMPVVVSTVQTQNSAHGDRKRMSRFKPQDFGLLIIDEAHRSLSPSYRDLINYYKTNNPNIKICGFTATPDLASEEAMGQIYESCPPEQQYEILDAIHDGWLCDVEQQFVMTTIDYSGIRTTCGDLNGADLCKVMEAERSMQEVAGATMDIVGDRRTLVFTASVHQAEMLCNIFNRHRAASAAWVCGATNKDDRRNLLTQYDEGKIQIMVNCNCLSEGYDSPAVEVVVQARPTKSRCLYAQQVGRCLRPLPGVVDGPETPELRRAAIAASKKPTALVVDFVGNSGRHKLMTSADILGGKVSEEAVDRAVKIAKSKGCAVLMSQTLDEAQTEIREKMKQARLAEEARKARLLAKVKFTSKIINPFDLFEIEPVKVRGWDSGKVLSEKQSKFLMTRGINPDKLPYNQARQVIGEMFRRMDKKLCTIKQGAALQKYGYNVKDMTFDQASKLIGQLKEKRWKSPSLDYVMKVNDRIAELKPKEPVNK